MSMFLSFKYKVYSALMPSLLQGIINVIAINYCSFYIKHIGYELEENIARIMTGPTLKLFVWPVNKLNRILLFCLLKYQQVVIK